MLDNTAYCLRISPCQPCFELRQTRSKHLQPPLREVFGQKRPDVASRRQEPEVISRGGLETTSGYFVIILYKFFRTTFDIQKKETLTRPHSTVARVAKSSAWNSWHEPWSWYAPRNGAQAMSACPLPSVTRGCIGSAYLAIGNPELERFANVSMP